MRSISKLVKLNRVYCSVSTNVTIMIPNAEIYVVVTRPLASIAAHATINAHGVAHVAFINAIPTVNMPKTMNSLVSVAKSVSNAPMTMLPSASILTTDLNKTATQRVTIFQSTA